MKIALEEARKGVGRTAPNPPVGAVMVRDGVELGRGWHRGAGLAHAEVEAIAAAEKRHGEGCLEGATAYVTLEPCSTTGKTPPCTGALIGAGIGRLVFACGDPNPLHAGGAAGPMKEAGIEVVAGIGADPCAEILRPFSKVKRTGLPWVIWKCAMSLDGRITRPQGEGKWLSGGESRADVQKLRAGVEAIVTSGETVRRDAPALTIRIPEYLEGRAQPWRVVVTDSPETMPAAAPLFSDGWKERTLIRDSADLERTLRRLVGEEGVLSVLLEAGGRFSAAMINAGLVDEAVIYYVPILCGGTVPALAGGPFGSSVKLTDVTWEKSGEDMKMRGLIV